LITGCILLTVAYDGTHFSGWAPQINSHTVTDELLGAIQRLRPAVRVIRGASRTDAGVHARGQRVAFDDDGVIPPKGWVLGLARHLPNTIAIRRAERRAAGFVPRFACRAKRYVYTLLADQLRDPFWEHRAYRHSHCLDPALLQAEAASVVGTHDFRAFRSSGDVRVDTVRTLSRVTIEPDGHDARVLRVIVEGNGFLYNMVRILVGTLLDVGRGHLAPGAMARAIVSGNRNDLGRTAPARGLLLDEIFFAEDGEEPWPGYGDATVGNF